MKRTSRMARIRTFLLAFLLLPSALVGQVQLTEAEERERALASLRGSGHGSAAVSVLTQEHRSRSSAEIDAFADSLVVIATSYSPNSSFLAQRAALSAAAALASAGVSERGVSYPRVFERLVRIYEGSDAGMKGGALGLMIELPNLGPVVDFLADVASSPGAANATTAIRHLANDTGPAGLARLRGLWERDEVVDPTAREHIAGIAHVLGWGR